MGGMTELSHAVGESEPPLLEQTIPDNLDATVAVHGAREALVDVQQGIRWTYAAFGAEVDRLARALLAEGVGAGDRVGVWSPNRAEWTVVQYATAKIGAILVNINPSYRTHELEYVLRQAGISRVFLADSFKTSDYVAMLAEVREACPDVRDAWVFGQDSWAGLLDRAGDVSAEQRVPGLLPEDVGVPHAGAARPHLVEHRDVVAGLERLGQEDPGDAGLLEDELQLVGAVARVDVDQDRPDLRGRVLHHRPLGAVRRPDADPIALRDPRGQQRTRQPAHLGAELRIRPTDPLRDVDQRLAVTERGDGRVEVVGNGLLEQGDVGLTRGVRQRCHVLHPTAPTAIPQPTTHRPCRGPRGIG